MMMSCIAYNLYLFLKHLAGGDFQTLTINASAIFFFTW
ncbi:hypothetical protein SPAR51_0606 [Streptococcus pneumoniae GA17719]|nr:hypothetical protein SPAR51_0606 [Streptococcus pneumoniae GA17719]